MTLRSNVAIAAILSFAALAGCMDTTTSAPQSDSAAQAQVAAPEVGFAGALSAASAQCLRASETGRFDASALSGAGFTNSPYNATEFRVQLNGAQAGQAFSVAFPQGGAQGCRIVTRYAALAPQIVNGAMGHLRSAGYGIQGTGANMTATKGARMLAVTHGKTQSTSIPFYQLSIEPK